MKKSLLLAVLLFTVFTISYAQGGRQRMSPEERAKRTTEWMKTELKLTQEQVVEIDSINLAYAKAQQSLLEEANGDRSKISEKMTALTKERNDAFSKVLTKEQMDLYKQKSRERRNNGRPRR